VACVNLVYDAVCQCSLHTRTWMYGNVYTCGNVSRCTF